MKLTNVIATGAILVAIAFSPVLAHAQDNAAAKQEKNSGSRGTGRCQLEDEFANCLGLMLPGSTRRSIRPFKAVEPFHSQFPILAGARSGDRHTPLSAFVAEGVLDTRNISLHD